MKNNFKRALICLLTFFLLIFNTLPVAAENKTVDDAKVIIDGIIAFNLEQTNSNSVNAWLKGELSKNPAAGAEWYVLALSQYGDYDFSSYEAALKIYLKNNKVSSASSRLKFALTLSGIGSTDEYIYNTLNDSIGKQGIMSYVYGLHILNNGYTSKGITKNTVINTLLSLQLSDGGFALYGANGDVDVTAMTVQALAPYYKTISGVKTAIDKAVSFLANKQNDDATFSSYGVKNPESIAQVIVALSAININPLTDNRFIKNEKTVLDAIKLFMLHDKSFSHTLNGSYNANATIQVLYSCVSLNRMLNGKNNFHILDKANVKGLNVPTNLSVSTTTTTSKLTTPDTNNNVSKNSAVNTSGVQSNISAVTSEDINVETGVPQVDNNTETKPISYKLYVTIGVIVLAAIIVVALIIFKKSNIKNIVLVLVIAAIIIALNFAINIQSTNDFYSSNLKNKPNAIGSVTIEINCNTIKDKMDTPVIIEKTKCLIEEGDTPYDILLEVTAFNKIHLETNGSTENIYVEGINNIYEFDYGELSGWMYFINGQSPQVSLSEYKLKSDDNIEILYTTNMGEDLK